MKTIDISVCVPVYGVEKYIEQCARSLFEQTLQDGIEFIFVNDCTKDRSIDILERVLDEYPQRKDQVKIIHARKNGGLATTRNIAMSHATGKFIINCDSDDWVEPNMYELLLQEALSTGADIVICGMAEEYAGRSNAVNVQLKPNSLEYVKAMLRGEMHSGTCNKLILKELYINHNISYPDGVNMWEDVNVIVPLTYYAKCISVIDKPMYHYRKTNGSSYTSHMTSKGLDNMKVTISHLEDFFIANHSQGLLPLVNYLKLTTRLRWLLEKSFDHKIKLYPESDCWIMSYRSISIYWRIAMKIHSIVGYVGFIPFYYCAKFLKKA